MKPPLVYDAALLAARAEITDVIHLFCHALDRHQWELMAQVFHPDATVEYTFRPHAQPYDVWLAAAKGTMASLTATLHHIGNILIEVDGDAAWSESYVTAIHSVPVGAPTTGFWDGRDAAYDGTGAGRYVDRFEKRDGRWRIAERQALIEWRHDEPKREGEAFAHIPPTARGRRGNDDISQDVVAYRLAG